MKVLALDPSSTVIGYCIGDDGRVVDAGRITPAKARATAEERIVSMAQQLTLEVITGSCVEWAIIEKPSKHVGGTHGGRGAGLATYGMAVGYVWHSVCAAGVARDRIRLVDPNEWTRGVSKARRARAVEARVRGYSIEADRGLDCADAIGLMQWWFQSRRA